MRTLHEMTKDVDIRTELASGMLQAFTLMGIEVAQLMLRAGEWDPTLLELDQDLIAAATAMDVPIDDPATWPTVKSQFADLRWPLSMHADEAGRDDTVLYRNDEEEDNFPRPAAETIIRHQPKVGRNDPCPCGSGKKYKKCCMKAEESLS
jgi:hypothetical protein